MIHHETEIVKNDETILTTIQQEYKILAEYKMIESEKPPGVYVIPSYNNSLIWFGVLFIRTGCFEGGIFRFNISLPDAFPDDTKPPAIIFQNQIFHPLICPHTGTLDITQAFPKWHTGEDHIWQILKYIIAIFIEPWDHLNSNNKNINQEAATLLEQNRNEYFEKAKQIVMNSKDNLYEAPPTNDPHYICFENFQKDVHDTVLEKIKTGDDIEKITPPNSGLSWVKEGEFRPLSKD